MGTTTSSIITEMTMHWRFSNADGNVPDNTFFVEYNGAIPDSDPDDTTLTTITNLEAIYSPIDDTKKFVTYVFTHDRGIQFYASVNELSGRPIFTSHIIFGGETVAQGKKREIKDVSHAYEATVQLGAIDGLQDAEINLVWGKFGNKGWLITRLNILFIVALKKVSVGFSRNNNRPLSLATNFTHRRSELTATNRRSIAKCPDRTSSKKAHKLLPLIPPRRNGVGNGDSESTPVVYIQYTTDVMGCELDEMVAVVENKHSVTNDVNKKNIIPTTQSIFSYNPNLQKVLLFRGKTLRSQILAIYAERRSAGNVVSEFLEPEPTEKDFFNLLMTYSTLRFMFSGLITNGKFEVEWLYRKYTKSFLLKLSKSDFACFLPLFTDSQFGLVGYDKYYKNGPCVC